MFLTKNGAALPFVAEASAFPGVVRVAEKVIADVEKVSGVKPALLRQAPDAPHVLCATLGCSAAADALIAAGKLPQAEIIRGKWECYVLSMVEGSLILLGSDKRGTEFGLFELHPVDFCKDLALGHEVTHLHVEFAYAACRLRGDVVDYVCLYC